MWDNPADSSRAWPWRCCLEPPNSGANAASTGGGLVRETTMQEWAIRILVLVIVFLTGYADLKILKSRGVACMTWLIGVMIGSFCVVYLPLPAPIGIIAGCVVFLCGVVALVVFYRGRPRQ